MRRVFVYVDGQNFHHGLRNIDSSLSGKTFDYLGFANYLAKDKQLVCVKYFGARYPREIDLAKHNSDDALFKSLEAAGIKVIEGTFLISMIKGTKVPREKGVDVRLATELIFDAFHDAYDDAYVLSADTDLIPAISEVKKKFTEKRIHNFSFRKLAAFEAACDTCLLIFPNIAKKFHNPKLVKPTTQSLAGLQNRFGASRPKKKP